MTCLDAFSPAYHLYHWTRTSVCGSALRVIGIALVCAVMAAACSPAPANTSGAVIPTATARPTDTLPTFSDWRVAYLNVDGHAHVVTLDGKTDVAGPALPGLTSTGLTFASGGVSPDGHRMAYAPTDLTIVDLASRNATVQYVSSLAYGIFWSADGSQLALDGGNGDIAIANSVTGIAHSIQGIPANTIGSVIGWIDGTHLAVTDLQGVTLVTTMGGKDQYATSISVAALDITNGHVQRLATIRSPGLGSWLFSLSPDGTKLLFSNAGYRGYPYTPLVEEIDTASGMTTPLPAIDRATGSGFSRVTWQRGTDLVAVSVGGKIWVLNLQHDYAQLLPAVGNVGGWSPDNSTLVLTDGWQIGIGDGPFIITALTLGANEQIVTNTTLTRTAMDFPFIGFVRTA